MKNKINNRILLIGYMGSGKTTVGKALSQLTDSRFIDMDKEIELIEKMPIRKIFMLFGEHEFRNKEAELLDKLCNITSAADIMTGGKGAIEKMMDKASKYSAFENLKDDIIVSCGGGIILDDLNCTILKDQFTIFLDGDPKLLFERVKEDKSNERPNSFMDIEDENIRFSQFLKRYESRRPLYEKSSKYTINIDGKTPDEIAEEIIKKIN
ncbi:shikimate kinase [Anaerovorax odorimutans]|uniref:shikimate kinase n=1 Tax=Anaerovorax odorimutans TaxID=109327 RepID=UPI000415BFA6|nr:shikimate kinase [Anaerovorax odorimutans]